MASEAVDPPIDRLVEPDDGSLGGGEAACGHVGTVPGAGAG